MQKCSWFAGLLILGFSFGCSGDTKPGGNSAAPKFEGEAVDGATAGSADASAPDGSDSADSAVPDATERENARADEAEMKDDELAAKKVPSEPELDNEQTAPPAAVKTASGGIFKGLTNSVLRGTRKTLSGSAKPTMSGPPPAEPKAEDDPFPNGEPSDKPADKPNEDQ